MLFSIIKGNSIIDQAYSYIKDNQHLRLAIEGDEGIRLTQSDIKNSESLVGSSFKSERESAKQDDQVPIKETKG